MNKNDFRLSMSVEGITEKQRLLALKAKYDNYEITEEEISDEDKKALIKLYDEETEKIYQEIDRMKDKIRTELKKRRNDNNANQ